MSSMLRLAGIVLLLAVGSFPEAGAHDPNLQAIAEFNKRLEENPDDLEALRARGSTFRALEYFDSAMIDLERAHGLDPDNAEVVGEIGSATTASASRTWPPSTSSGRTACSTSRSRRAPWPRSTPRRLKRELYEYLFHHYADLGRYEDALEQGIALGEFLSGKLSYRCDMADIYLALGRVEEALPAYRDAAEAAATFERYVVGAANVYLRLGRGPEALALLDDWLVADPESPVARLHRGRIYAEHLEDEVKGEADLAEGERILRDRMKGGVPRSRGCGESRALPTGPRRLRGGLRIGDGASSRITGATGWCLTCRA